MKTDSKYTALSAQQEQLLMRSFDGECGIFEQIKVRSLLRKSAAARSFLEELSAMKPVIVEAVEKGEYSKNIDLWERIERRIADEEHAALFLGKRTFSDGEPNRISKPWLLIAAPLSAAALALFFYLDSPKVGGPSTQSIQSANSDLSSSLSARTVALGPTAPTQRIDEANPLEVEWIRSEGRVSMIQNTRGRVPILWINRQQALRALEQRQVHRLKDGSELRIMNERVPGALTVANE